MKIKDAIEYLSGNGTMKIEVGKSGAEVYDIDGRYILKHVSRERLGDAGLYAAYKKEAMFYDWTDRQEGRGLKRCLPEISELEESEREIFILMKKYDVLSGRELSEKLFREIMRALALVHTCKIPDFLRAEKKSPELLSAGQLEKYCIGWQEVLAEHPEAFDISVLGEMAERMNDIILWHHGEEKVLTHGDFHLDNLLKDENGKVRICDWQGGCEGGASGDLSFFLSRLSADGIRIDRRLAAETYAEQVRLLTGRKPDAEILLGHMDAANVITSFVFWHRYLHGSPEERVRGIYVSMTEGYDRLVRRNICRLIDFAPTGNEPRESWIEE